jgi:hypothetical protein
MQTHPDSTVKILNDVCDNLRDINDEVIADNYKMREVLLTVATKWPETQTYIFEFLKGIE